MKIKEATILPQWLRDNLDEACPYCGGDLEIGVNMSNNRVTEHFCPNQSCPGTLAAKMAFVWTVLKVPGIKEGKSLSLARTYKLKHHLDAVPLVCGETKPRIGPITFMRLQCIKGIDESWDGICKGKETIEDIITSREASKYMSLADIENARRVQEYFEIVFPKKKDLKCVASFNIMITGNLTGYEPREIYAAAINHAYKGLVEVRVTGKRVTGVSALVTENPLSGTGKAAVARERGIPIMSPAEFLQHVDSIVKERTNNEYDLKRLHS